MGDTTNDEQAETATSSPSTEEPAPPTEVEITVAGHTVVVKAAEPMADVTAEALRLFRATSRFARRLPVGFDTAAGQIERAEPYQPVDRIDPFGPDEDRR